MIYRCLIRWKLESKTNREDLTPLNSKTAYQWKKELNLETEPDAYQVELLNLAHTHQYRQTLTKTAQTESTPPEPLFSPKPQTSERLRAATKTPTAYHNLSDFLIQARVRSGLTVRQVAQRYGSSPGRVSVLEHSENLQLMTLVSFLESMGYQLRIEAKKEGGKTIAFEPAQKEPSR